MGPRPGLSDQLLSQAKRIPIDARWPEPSATDSTRCVSYSYCDLGTVAARDVGLASIVKDTLYPTIVCQSYSLGLTLLICRVLCR